MWNGSCKWLWCKAVGRDGLLIPSSRQEASTDVHKMVTRQVNAQVIIRVKQPSQFIRALLSSKARIDQDARQVLSAEYFDSTTFLANTQYVQGLSAGSAAKEEQCQED